METPSYLDFAFQKNFVQMKFSFVAMKFFLFLIIFAICKSHEDTEGIHANDLLVGISRCILYRFIPYREESNGTLSINKNSTDNSFKIEKSGISYRYIPCQENWTALTITYESQDNFFQTENIRLKNYINQCQIDRIQHKTKSDEQAKLLNEKKHLQELNLTECLNEEKSKRLWFESQIKNCQISNNYSEERIANVETEISKLESDFNWCLNEGKNKTLFIVTETENCQQQNSILNKTISICNAEKLEIESNYTECLIERKNESLRFASEIKNCESSKNSFDNEFLSCEDEMKDTQISLTECQTKNWTKSLELELEKCQHLYSQLNEKLTSCNTTNVLLESNLTGCLDQVKKNTSHFDDEIRNYKYSNNSGIEILIVCEDEKRKSNYSLTGCLSEGENKTSLLEAEINQIKKNITALNLKVPLCEVEKANTNSNLIECLNNLKNKTRGYEAEIDDCQDFRYDLDEEMLICEKDKMKMVGNLTACLNIDEDENLQRAMAYAKKYQDLSLLYENKCETCDIEKRKLETNLTGCLDESKNKIMELEDNIRNYENSNYSLSEKISICNAEKAKMDSKLNECLTETENTTTLLEATINKYKKENLTLNAKIATCYAERKSIIVNLTRCVNDANTTAKYNLKKDPFINYISSIWNGTTFPIDYNSPSYASIVVYDRYNVARLGLFPLADAESLKPWFGPVINDILSFQYLISMPQCTSSSQPSLYIAVISTPDSFEKRERIRKDLRTSITSHIGVLGKISFGFFIELTDSPFTQTKIEEESNTYADIVQLNMVIKSYRDSTLKMAAVLNWINSYCSSVSFIFKVEEDVKFEMSKLVRIVTDHHQSTLILVGVPADNGSVTYRGGGTRAISYEEFPWNNYPGYFNGSAYFMHGTSIPPILACFQTTPIFPFEDVYVTGLCRQKAGIKRLECQGNVASNFCF